jgi:hypothetical protein
MVCLALLLHIPAGLSSNVAPGTNILYKFPQFSKENSEILCYITSRALQDPHFPQILYYPRFHNYSGNKASFIKYTNEYGYRELFPQELSGRSVKLTTDLHLVPRSRKV